jgi:hypothetical protein
MDQFVFTFGEDAACRRIESAKSLPAFCASQFSAAQVNPRYATAIPAAMIFRCHRGSRFARRIN